MRELGLRCSGHTSSSGIVEKAWTALCEVFARRFEYVESDTVRPSDRVGVVRGGAL